MESNQYDAIILGGAFSGASAALLLLRQKADWRILIIETKEAFDGKVGEATVELSAMFLHKRLGLWDYLSREQLPKQGLRFWFNNMKTEGLLDSAEAGPGYSIVVPSFQLQRDTLDEHLLSLAVKKGAMLARPARVTGVALKDFDNTVTYQENGAEMSARAPWVLDATGKAAHLGRQLGLIEPNLAHPIAAVWARYEGVLDLDANLYPRSKVWNNATLTSRRLATNHFTGLGYWVWVIPLRDGSTSVGLVYDKRLVKLPAGPRGEAFLNFINGIPGLRQLMAGATLREGDLRNYDQLAYTSKQFMGRGWVLLGDAAGFLDPYYSPGLDYCAISCEAATRVIGRALGGRLEEKLIDSLIATHNDHFKRSYDWTFQAIYQDKYYLLGECDLVTASFLIDTSLYYFFRVRSTAKTAAQFTNQPSYHTPLSGGVMKLERFLTRRMIRIACNRLRAGTAGRVNDGRRIKVAYNLGLKTEYNFYWGIKLWLKAELRNMALAPRLWFKPAADDSELSRLAMLAGVQPMPKPKLMDEAMPAPMRKTA